MREGGGVGMGGRETGDSVCLGEEEGGSKDAAEGKEEKSKKDQQLEMYAHPPTMNHQPLNPEPGTLIPEPLS